MEELSHDQKFQALLHRHKDQAETLYRMTNIDLNIFRNYAIAQMVFGGWIAANPDILPKARTGLLVIDIGVALFVTVLLVFSYMRRIEVIATLRNVNMALGYETKGDFVPDVTINYHMRVRVRFWLWPYLAGVVLIAIGIWIILYSFPLIF